MVPQVNGRIALSTKTLEPEPGDMIKNPQKVYDMAEVRLVVQNTKLILVWYSMVWYGKLHRPSHLFWLYTPQRDITPHQ